MAGNDHVLKPWWKAGNVSMMDMPAIVVHLKQASEPYITVTSTTLGCAIALSQAPCRYENLVQVRCLLEGFTEEDILQNWHTILPDSMQRWHLDRQEVSASPACSQSSIAELW